jgi:hypothetical protein
MNSMKRSIIAYCFICAFLCKGFSGKTENPSQIAYPDSIFSAGNYSFAAMEYERIFFSSESSTEKTVALLKKSFCYKNLLQYGKANTTLERINTDSLSDSLQYAVRYEKALNSFLGESYYNAQGFLYEIRLYTKNTELISKSLYLEILTENELRNWDKADSLLMCYLAINKTNIDSSELNVMLSRPKLLNPKTAKILSYIIPGSGQMMSGHVFRGLTSIVFQGSAAAFTYLSIKNGFYVSGFTTGLGIFEMLYSGGARYAYKLVLKKNSDKINSHNQKIRDFVLMQESLRNK